jgi:hypothetical protein
MRFGTLFILLDATAKVEPETGLPPRLKVPKANWFDLDRPATADPENDWLIGIYNGRSSRSRTALKINPLSMAISAARDAVCGLVSIP